MDILRSINRDDGITVICNLHTIDTARAYCDRIIGMRMGRVVFDGRPGPRPRADPGHLRTDGSEDEIDENITSTAAELRRPPIRSAGNDASNRIST